MHIKSIVTVCILMSAALVSATQEKPQGSGNGNDNSKGSPVNNASNGLNTPQKDNKASESTTSVIKPDATLADIKLVECSKFNAKDLNNLTNQSICKALDHKCIDQFNVTDVKCVSAIPTKEWKKFSNKSVQQIISSGPQTLNMSAEQLGAILPNMDLATIPNVFASYVVRSQSLLETILSSGEEKIVVAFITSKTLPQIADATFARFNKVLVAALNDDAFSQIKPQQLALMSADSFNGFSEKKWSAVNPQALVAINRLQAANLSAKCWNATTSDQVKSFGQSAKKFSAQSADPKDVILERRQFVESHPCGAFESKKKDMDSAKLKPFEERCSEISQFNVSSAASLSSSIAIAGAVVGGIAMLI